jgi:hypothetical protein
MNSPLAKLADAIVLETIEETREGSSPSRVTVPLKQGLHLADARTLHRHKWRVGMHAEPAHIF